MLRVQLGDDLAGPAGNLSRRKFLATLRSKTLVLGVRGCVRRAAWQPPQEIVVRQLGDDLAGPAGNLSRRKVFNDSRKQNLSFGSPWVCTASCLAAL